MTHPSKAIEQAIEAFAEIINLLEYEVSGMAYKKQIAAAKQSIADLRSMQSVKMMDVNEWHEWFVKTPSLCGSSLPRLIELVREEAFTAGLMSQSDARKVRDDGVANACIQEAAQRLIELTNPDMVLMPRIPTEKMLLAGINHDNMGDMEGGYKAMIAAYEGKK